MGDWTDWLKGINPSSGFLGFFANYWVIGIMCVLILAGIVWFVFRPMLIIGFHWLVKIIIGVMAMGK
jgi:hypothetical protein